MSNDGGVSRRQVEKLADLSVSARRERVSELGDLLAGESQYVRQRAMELLVEVAQQHPGVVAPVVDPVAEQLGTEALGADAARVVGAVAAEEPSVVKERLPLLIAVLDSGGAVTVHVTYALASIGAEEPEGLARRGILDTLFELVDDENPTVRTNVTRILGDVARTEPGAVAEAATRLRARLDDESSAVQQNVAYALGQTATESPGAVFEAFDALCDRLESSDPGVRASAAYALAAVATAGDALAPTDVDSLLGLLQADRPAVRQQAGFVLSAVAEADPAALVPHARRLTRAVAERDPQVRRNLLVALERLESANPDAVETAQSDVADALETVDPEGPSELTPDQLRGLADDDRAPDPLRQAARDALAGAGTEPVEHTPESEVVGRDGETAAGSGDRQCPNCGEVFGPDATFCSVCGTSLE